MSTFESFSEYQLFCEEVNLAQLEFYQHALNKIFTRFGVLLQFSGHFKDRVNDPRNQPPISAQELNVFFDKIMRQYARRIAAMHSNEQGLMKDTTTNLTVAYVIIPDHRNNWNRLICKSVMRKKVYGNDNFPGDNETLTVK